MLEARNIYKSYQSLEVIKGVDLVVEKGQVVSITGASGAGKSTLLHILGTLDIADKGEVLIKGSNVQRLAEKKLAQFRNQHIGFIFQFHNLFPEFSAIENITIPAMIGGRQATKDAEQLLDLLNIRERKDHKPSELSGGEQQRVSVARALINKPAIVFADEPSGNLDSQNADELHQLFFELRKELDQTFVIVTHDQKLAEMADRTILMRDGLIVES